MKLSFKAIILGAIVDVVGTNIWGLIVGIYLVNSHHLMGLPPAEQTAQLKILLTQGGMVQILTQFFGGAFTIFGGYIAARIAKHDELLNGACASFLCVLFALFAIGSAPISSVLIGVIANPVLGLAGGYIRVWEKQRTKEQTPKTI